VISVTGGKLTTYRKMAADTVDVVVRQLGTGSRRSPTKRMALRGAAGRDAVGGQGLLSPAAVQHLIGRHGGEAADVIELIAAEPERHLAEALVPGLPYLRGEAVWAVREEMAQTLDDVLARRTRSLLRARDATADAAEEVARLIAPERGWSPEEAAQQVTRLRAAVAHERQSARLAAKTESEPQAGR
jgi:glycerol-3-phosphate dehydrogenase